MGRRELTVSVMREFNIMRSTASAIVDHILLEIARTICRDKKLELRGFGTFEVRRILKRRINVVRFKAGKDLRRAVQHVPQRANVQ